MTALELYEKIKNSHGEIIADKIFAYLRSPLLGTYIGAMADCTATLRYDMRKIGIVDVYSGLNEFGLKISMTLKS